MWLIYIFYCFLFYNPSFILINSKGENLTQALQSMQALETEEDVEEEIRYSIYLLEWTELNGGYYNTI